MNRLLAEIQLTNSLSSDERLSMSEHTIFAAHIKDYRIQSVHEHCENVAAYASEEAESTGLSQTLRLAGLLHDIGKSTKAFDQYIHNATLDASSVKKINHSSAGGRYLYESVENIEGFRILAAQLIAYAVVSHHGLFDLVNLVGEDNFERRIYPEKDNFYGEVLENAQFIDGETVRRLYEAAVEEINDVYIKIKGVIHQMQATGEAGFFMLGGLQRLILSYLVDADWRDTAEFMDNRKISRLTEGELSIKWCEYANRLETKINLFGQDNALAKLRREMSEQCLSFAAKGNGIYRLAIPTGGGKTLAGMRYALELAKREKKKHIYYIAPYLSILEQNAGEIRRIFSDEENVLEYHSNMIVSDKEGDDVEKGGSLSIDWAEPVILTTMVQFLNTLFSGDMKSVRRFHQLTDAVIILDEAQSIPVKCLCLFTTMMNFLSLCCNTTIVICTATQPLFEKIGLVYSQPADIISQIDQYHDGFKRTELMNCAEKKRDTDGLADMVCELLERNILIILNTKSAVQTLFQEISKRVDEEVVLFQLTTYMCAAHRLDVIENMKKLLKEGSKRVICVSTQLVEAGVDISFEKVVRSLAGLDSIAQAAGRCNRNAEREQGTVYLVDYAEENVSRLRDIKLAQDATRLVLDRFKGDLLSREAMELYYREYFFKRREEMKYNLEDINDTLYDLLAENRKHRPKSYKYLMSQSFQTAGTYFKVIEDADTIGVIVPYGQAKEYISELRQTRSIQDAKYLLKKLQRYTVNIYKTDRKLESLMGRNAIDKSVLEGRVFILDEGFYDDNGLSDTLELLAF